MHLGNQLGHGNRRAQDKGAVSRHLTLIGLKDKLLTLGQKLQRFAGQLPYLGRQTGCVVRPLLDIQHLGQGGQKDGFLHRFLIRGDDQHRAILVKHAVTGSAIADAPADQILLPGEGRDPRGSHGEDDRLACIYVVAGQH